jgi:hypothetical protein
VAHIRTCLLVSFSGSGPARPPAVANRSLTPGSLNTWHCSLAQVDLKDIELAVVYFGDPLELAVDTHRSCDIDATPREAKGTLMLSTRKKVDVPDLLIDPLPLRTPRQVETVSWLQGSEELAGKIDIELRKALEGAKLIGEWSASLFGGGGIVVPGPVQQVTEQYLRSTECTPAATPRDRETIGAPPQQQGPIGKGCAHPDGLVGRSGDGKIVVGREGDDGVSEGRGKRREAEGEGTLIGGKGCGAEEEAKPAWHESLISSLFGSGAVGVQHEDALSPNADARNQGILYCVLCVVCLLLYAFKNMR